MLLYIIRHGDPIYAPDSLTPRGHLQAKALAKRLALQGLDKIFVSPLIRARQTAQPTCELLGIKPVVEEWTSENLAYKDLSVQNPDGSRRWAFACQNTNILNNETVSRTDWYNTEEFLKTERAKQGYERICKSSDEFLKKLGYERDGAVYKIIKPSDERVAVFCHEGFGTTWLSHLLNIPPHIFWAGFGIAHTGVTVLYFENFENGICAPRCICLSDLSHIYADRLPLEAVTFISRNKL